MLLGAFFQDLESGCLTEVPEATCYYDDAVRELRTKQTFYVYPDGEVYSLVCVDCSYTLLHLSGDDLVIFVHRYPGYF